MSKSRRAETVIVPSSADIRSAAAADADIEIRGGNVHVLSPRIQQDVGKDRNRALLFDDTLHQVQLAEQ